MIELNPVSKKNILKKSSTIFNPFQFSEEFPFFIPDSLDKSLQIPLSLVGYFTRMPVVQYHTVIIRLVEQYNAKVQEDFRYQVFQLSLNECLKEVDIADIGV